MVASYASVEIGGIRYNLNADNGEAEVASNHNSYKGHVVIPPSVEYEGVTYNVTSIGSTAFNSCHELISVSIPSSVVTINTSAFGGCKKLTTVNMSEGLTTIGESVFNGCFALCNVTIPNTVVSIGKYAFQGCTSLSYIVIPSSVTSIGVAAFGSTHSLQSIIVEDGNSVYDSRDNCNAIIKTSNNMLVAGCINTTIPNSVTQIGSYGFSGCINLSSITIPNSVTWIGNYAFNNCTSLTSITIPNSVTGIGSYAFHYCSSLTTITLSDGLKDIGEFALANCSSLTSITFPNSVTNIGMYAFQGCPNLVSVSLSNSLKYLREGVFAGCPITSITIPNSVETISQNAFWLTGLTSITIPASVRYIQERAFWECSNLESITVESGNLTYDSRNNCNAIITTYDNTLIAGCKNTAIPKGVVRIGGYSFSGHTELTSISIPKSVIRIGDFSFGGCTGIQDVYCFIENIPGVAWTNAFDGSNRSNATLHVPAVAIDDYRSISPWKEFGNIVPLTDDEIAAGIDVAASKLADDDSWYTIDGRKLSGEQTKAGIYIHKGRVVMK